MAGNQDIQLVRSLQLQETYEEMDSSLQRLEPETLSPLADKIYKVMETLLSRVGAYRGGEMEPDRRKNVSDAQIVVELMAGATTKEIINKLGMSMAGSTYKRIDKLRLENPVPEIEDLSGFFDLNLDTLKDKERYRVIAIDERALQLRA